jgi:hypothetical protein
MLVYEAIPAVWKEGIPALANRKFAFTRYSFEDIVKSTMARAFRVVESAGGRVTDQEIVVRVQEPLAPVLEQWTPGVPVARLVASDAAWSWKGAWTGDEKFKESATPGASAELVFSGTGVAIVGRGLPDGGRADVALDGKPAGEIDAYVAKDTNDNDAWHRLGLFNGRHTVRITVRGEADSRSTGAKVRLERAVVYGPRP